MAILREQRNLVSAIYSRPFNKGLMVSASEDVLLHYFLENPLFLSDKGIAPVNLSERDVAEREHRIITLIRACTIDKFIDPVKEDYEAVDYSRIGLMNDIGKKVNGLPVVTQTRDLGYYATSRGTDLLNSIGFLTIATEKHKVLTLIITSNLITGIAVWFVTNTPHLICAVYESIGWCST